MSRYIADIETNGLLKQLTKIHSLCLLDVDTEEVLSFTDDHPDYRSIKEGLDILANCEEFIGHNFMEFDLPAIQKVYPDWTYKGQLTDTLIVSRLIYTHLRQKDFDLLASKPDFPKYLIGRHSMEAWGMRLGFPKDDYKDRMKEKGIDPWENWNQDMQDYCEIDVKVNLAIYRHFLSMGFSEESWKLEHDTRRIIKRQEDYGFLFDTEAAASLYSVLVKERIELTNELVNTFGSFYVRAGRSKSAAKNMKRFVENPHGNTTRLKKVTAKEREADPSLIGDKRVQRGWYEHLTEGVSWCPVKLVQFNPGSRDHIAMRLIAKYGWKPTKLTPEGKPAVDEEVLASLKYPEAKLLNRYLLLNKRIGQLAEGKEAWLKRVKEDGRMHGKVQTNGAVTGRMTHSGPNMAQAPAPRSEFGAEMRACFKAPPGYMISGTDASGLELRCLGHYMARWDDGVYGDAAVKGKSSEGTDAHTVNQKAVGLKSRDSAKTWFYAFIYGAGDFKLGEIVAEDFGHHGASAGALTRAGKKSRSRIESNLPALGNLIKAVKSQAKKRGYLIGLDGRKLWVRSQHSALNTLLQGAGAIIMKKALVLLDDKLQELGYVPGYDYEFVANIHDEFQIEVRTSITKLVGKHAEESIYLAGKHFDFKTELAGESKSGANWAETH